MDNSQRVARWLRPMVFPSDITKSPSPERVEIRHLNVNEKTTPVREFNVSVDGQAALTALSEDISSSLIDDAAGLGGVQKYVVSAWIGDKSVGRLTLRARGEEDEEDREALSEPANGKGLVAQSMRHTEAMMRLALVQASGSERAMASLERQNALLQQLVETSLEKQLEAVKLVEDLMSQKNKREIRVMEAQAGIETRQMMGKHLLPMVATIVKKVTGDTNINALPSEVHQLRTFIGSLTPEQVEAIAGSLTPAQQVALSDMLSGANQEAPEQ